MVQVPESLPQPPVVVPVFEDGPGVLRLVEALLGGTLHPGAFILIDSSVSEWIWRDTLPEVERRAGAFGIGVVTRRLEAGRFNHGWTRNLGVALASAPYVALFSQDAVPEPGCLEQLVRRIAADQRLAGVYARQLPFPGTSEPVRRRIEAHYPDQIPRSGNGEGAPSGLVRFDNVAAVIRTKAWDEIQFPNVEIAEDLEWARALSAKGWTFAYEPGARVRHAHELSGRHDFDRNRKLHRLLARNYGVRTVASLGAAIRETLGLIRKRQHAPGEAASEVFGQYLGGLQGELDKLLAGPGAATR